MPRCLIQSLRPDEEHRACRRPATVTIVLRSLAFLLVALIGCHGDTSPPQAQPGSATAPATRPPLVETKPRVVTPDARAPRPPPRVEHAAWKLVDNRHAAHRAVAGELVVDASDVGFARYTRFGIPAPRWKIGAVVDGERAAIAERLASLELPLSAEAARAATQLTARVHATGKQSVTLRINGKNLDRKAAVPLDPGWQTIAIAIPPNRLVAGENQLVVETAGRGQLALAWLRVGAIAPPGDDDPRTHARFDAAGDALELGAGASLAWYVTIPNSATLVGEVAAPCRVDVTARASDDSQAAGVLGGDIERVELGALAGKVVRLELTARDCPRARVVHPHVALVGPEPHALPTGEPPRYVILWVWDAVRADRIPLFQPGARTQTPTLDELAQSGVAFRQFYVQGNESQTSHSSMFTALYPAVHEVRLAGQGGVSFIRKQFPVLAAELADAGYATLAVTGNGYVNSDSGYNRGFREFKNPMRDDNNMNPVIYGKTIVDMAMKRLDAHRDEPTFLFLGTIDNHSPWIARRPWVDIYSPHYKGPFVDIGTAEGLGLAADSMGCAVTPPKEDIERLVAIYDSAISYQDRELGRLVAQLKSWGIWDQTMLLVTADHGDELFEDGRCGHGGSLRETLVRVPLLVHDPSRFPGGTIVDEGVEEVDLVPTILAAIGRPLFPGAQGEALEPIAQGIGRGWPRPSYASMYEYAHAMRIGRWKIRVGPTAAVVVDDVVADLAEHAELSATRPTERRMLTDNLGLFLALRTKWKKTAWGVTTNVTAEGAAALDEATTP
jgi:arylsulfatase A-like enzyme